MTKLLRAEFFKLSKSLVFRLLLIFSLWMGFLYGITAIRRNSSVAGFDVYFIGLKPDILYAFLISIFTSSFVCSEFSDRTFSMGFFCGYARWNVFLAKAIVFFTGMFPIVFFPLAVSTAVATVNNGFGREWEAYLIFEVLTNLICFIFRNFVAGSYALFAASIIRNRIGSFGIGMMGIYIMMFLSISNLESSETLRFIIISLSEIIAMAAASLAVFEIRELK